MICTTTSLHTEAADAVMKKTTNDIVKTIYIDDAQIKNKPLVYCAVL